MSRPRRFLLLLAYLAFLVVLFEGTARLIYSVPWLARQFTTGDEMSWHRRWIERHRDSGTQIFYRFDAYDPTKGWKSKPDLRNVWVFDSKVLNTNSLGFRGVREYAYAKDPERTRILALGDSFTFGDEVSDEETYPHYLQETLPQTEVMNLGVHGYGHDQMLILLREEALRYEPDIVLLGYISSDMKRNLLGFKDYAKPRFVLVDGKLQLRGTPVPPPEEVLRRSGTRWRVLDLFSYARYGVMKKTGLLYKRREAMTAALLGEIAATVRESGAVPVFVYLLSPEEYGDEAAAIHNERFLMETCRRQEATGCVSTRPRFLERMAAGVTFKPEGHWGPTGHRTVAEVIATYLVAEGLVTGAGGSPSP